MSLLVGGNRQIDTFNNFNILRFLDGTVTIANATTYRVSDSTGFDQFTGNFIYNSDGVLIGGTITGWSRSSNGGTEFTLSGFSYPVATFRTDLETADNAGALALLFGGPDKMTGSTNGDVLFSYGGNDTVSSGGSGDIVYVGDGHDLLDGGAEGDILHGEAGNDTVIGGGGGDIAYGDDNNDSVAGGAGSDILFGNAGADTVDGGADGDIIFGDTENDSVLGGAGDDILYGGAGTDTIAGGSGNDIYADVESIDKITEMPGQGIDRVQTSDDYTLLANFEELLLGGSGDFYGKGNSAANEITGNSGKNQLFGFDGNDTLNGGTGIDSLFGGKGDDVYFVNETAEQVTEALGEGKDTVNSSAAAYTLSLNIENLTLLAAAANGTGNGLANKIIGQDEDNTLDGLNGNDTIDGGAGKDNLLGATENDSLLGGAGNDTLNGESGEDTLLGGEGSDVIDGGNGVDVMIGGNASDKYYVFDSSDKIVEAAGPAGGIDTVFAFVNHTLAANVEDVELYGSAKAATGNGLDNLITSFVATAKLAGLGGNDEITGGAGNDTLDGGAGNDSLFGNGGNDSAVGGAGNDQFFGHAGNNTMAGGAGNEIYIVESAGDLVVDGAGQGSDMVIASVDYVLSDTAEIELFFLSGAAALNGTGSKFANYISGNFKDNSLAGGGGNDTLDGGTGADSMSGGIGNDSYAIDNAGDKVTEAPDEGTDTIVTLIDNINLGVILSVENLTLAEGSAAFKGTGSGLANVLIGNSEDNNLFSVGGNDTVDGRAGHDSIEGSTGNDSLTGGEGFDTLDGGIGDDTMIGGLNADHFYVDSAKDIVIEAAAGSLIDQVFTKFDNTKLANNVEYLILEGVTVTGFGNTSNNRVTGNGNNNKLYGLAGNDSVFGGIGNDLLDGGAGNDELEAGSGADTMVGGAGNDRYLIENNLGKIVEAAGGGIDTLESDLTTANLADYVNIENLSFSTAASSVGSGDKFNNLLEGNIGNDSLLGLGGNDTLHGGAGNDTMVGDIGDDVYYLLDAGDVIVESADAGKDTLLVDLPSIDLSVAPYQNIENVILANNANNAQGNGLANTITGNTKGNILLGGGGNDTLFGEIDGSSVGSADTLSGEAGNDLMVGGRGSDWYLVTEPGDKIVEQAGQGTDLVFAAVDYTLAANVEQLSMSGAASKGTGNALDNFIGGNTSKDVILGLGGKDTLNGNDGNDTIDGGAGDDSINGGADNDKLLGGAQSDYLQGEDGADTLIGGDGLNGMHGDAGNDSLIGGSTYDTMDGGIGVDTMAGGGGQDAYVVDNSNDKIVEAAVAGVDYVYASVSYVLSDNVETLYLDVGAVSGTGNAGANFINGSSGTSNKLSGLAGNDTLIGGTGGEADTMLGGAGNDTYYVDSLLDVVDDSAGSGGSGKDTILSNISIAALNADIENLILNNSALDGTGNSLGNKIEGTFNTNNLAGLAGADTLFGYNGADTLNGGDGADSMIGGADGDDYYVNNAGDKVVEAAGGGSDWVYADVNHTLAANVENLVLLNAENGTGNGLGNRITGNSFANKIAGLGGDDTVDSGAATDTIDGGIGNDHLMAGTENDSLIGGAGNDTLEGEDGADSLVGGAGNDYLAGGDSADSLAGGAGDDSYFVDLGTDAIVEGAGQGIDVVFSTANNLTLANNVENLKLSNAAVTGIGNDLNNLIQGASVGIVANNLQGGAGNDTLSGFGGADTLTGGAGRDTFRVWTSDNVDTLTDFDAGPLGDALDLSDLLSNYTSGVSDPNDFVQLVPGGGNTAVLVDVDGTANGVSFVQVATLQSVTLTNVNQAVLEGNLELG